MKRASTEEVEERHKEAEASHKMIIFYNQLKAFKCSFFEPYERVFLWLNFLSKKSCVLLIHALKETCILVSKTEVFYCDYLKVTSLFLIVVLTIYGCERISSVIVIAVFLENSIFIYFFPESPIVNVFL